MNAGNTRRPSSVLLASWVGVGHLMKGSRVMERECATETFTRWTKQVRPSVRAGAGIGLLEADYGDYCDRERVRTPMLSSAYSRARPALNLVKKASARAGHVTAVGQSRPFVVSPTSSGSVYVIIVVEIVDNDRN
ncbi:hypothetical protein EVAR_49573_1 [Eumeta japonica]|uniref:Uncharacterized protein n=1 Tax=Eumeta variegata TaxID=151549 RepID=A0A4C1YQ32_EUMVA|nr:hypothetical protein EVAR_49573_1 [Eumeta japonica]